jgi:DNA-directed RNA polymerase sigma subunit (sigma70/sigma32)
MKRNWSKHNKAKTLRESGMTYEAIAKELGVTRERVRQMVKTMERLAREGFPIPQETL